MLTGLCLCDGAGSHGRWWLYREINHDPAYAAGLNFHHIANIASAILMRFWEDRALRACLPSGYALGLVKLL